MKIDLSEKSAKDYICEHHELDPDFTDVWVNESSNGAFYKGISLELCTEGAEILGDRRIKGQYKGLDYDVLVFVDVNENDIE